MKHIDSESPSDVAHWLRNETAPLWPALLGSLSLHRSRCIRKNCPACQSGEQHQSYVLYDRAKGRRVAVSAPEDLVPEIQRSLDNGRALQQPAREPLLFRSDGAGGLPALEPQNRQAFQRRPITFIASLEIPYDQ